MSYTLSMDASVRVKKYGMGNYFRHIYRELYPDAKHENENIDPMLTMNNISLVYDDEKGDMVKLENVDDLKKITSDIETYSESHTIRSDACYLRPLMLQLGSGFYQDHPKGVSVDGTNEFGLMYQWACSVWGKERIRGVSIHRDEVHHHEGHEGEISPHMVLLISPVDGESMSQKNIINGKKHLKALHGSFRQFMADRGLDIQIENLETSAPHRKDAEYKAFKDKQRELKAKEIELKKQRKQLEKLTEQRHANYDNAMAKVKTREQKVTKREQEVADRELKVSQREQEIADREPKVSQREQEVTDRELKVSRREKKLEDDEKKLEDNTNALLKDNDRLEDALIEAEGMIPHIQAQIERERKQEQVERMRNVHEELENKYRGDIEGVSDLLKRHTVTRDDISIV